VLNKYFEADFICFDQIIVEIKSVTELKNIHKAQVINYLKATGKKLGILINFGEESLKYERLVRF
jgi:GxxExxY protein